MRKTWMAYPHVRTVQPFVVVDSFGRPCGEYPTIPEADMAVDTWNRLGNHGPYTIARPGEWKAAS